MKKFALSTVVAVAAMAAASPAMAQDADSEAGLYAGLNAGYHDLGDNSFGDDDGFIYGGFVGVDVPVGETLIIGAEANYTLGTGVIDSEYGIVAKAGIRAGDNGQVFVRGGYQEVDFDIQNLVGVPVPGVDDTEGDYMGGVGGQFKASEKVSIRGIVDSIAFDSVRATVGVSYHF